MCAIEKSLVLAATLIVATATTAASEDVQDARLRVRNLTRPDGAQTAVYSGRVMPSDASRSVTATLQVGATTATLSGKIGRSGRVHLVGRRLALATALAAFARIEVDLASITAASVFAAADCLRLLRGRMLDCPGSVGATGPLLDGVYDLGIDTSAPSTTTHVARLGPGAGDTRYLTLHASALDVAGLALTTNFTLSGDYVLGGDAFITVAGIARDESTPDLSHLSGSFASTSALGFSRVFVMQRPVDGTPGTLGGTWTIALSESGMMALTLAVGTDGSAGTMPTIIVRSNGSSAYTIRAGACDVAPSGGLHCDLGIDDPPNAYRISLHGVLDAAGGSGQGSYAIGAPPVLMAQGTWTATR